MKAYYGTKLIHAEPQDKDGVAGFHGVYQQGQENEYHSWSPADVFQEAYQTLESMSFGHAIKALQDGKKVARIGWNGIGQTLELQVPDANSKMTLPYIFITTVTGYKIPWLASQTDLLSNDWMIVE